MSLGKSEDTKIFYSSNNFILQIDEWKQAGCSITFTNGCFDIIHAGHIMYLKEACGLADKLVVGLNSDSSVSQLKGPNRPINKEQDRALVLSNLQMVDLVIIFDADTPLELIDKINPDYLVKGGDYKVEDIVGAELVKARGKKVLCLSEKEGYSTTKLIAQLNRQQCK